MEKISEWAVEAMEWAVNAKLLSGTGDNLLSPAGTATRAQVAQVLANFLPDRGLSPASEGPKQSNRCRERSPAGLRSLLVKKPLLR